MASGEKHASSVNPGLGLNRIKSSVKSNSDNRVLLWIQSRFHAVVWIKWKHEQCEIIVNKTKTTRNRCVIELKNSLLQRLGWRCAECAVHHERNVCEEQHHIYVARTSNNRVFAACDLYCCLQPQCEALRTCRTGFPIATSWTTIRPKESAWQNALLRNQSKNGQMKELK